MQIQSISLNNIKCHRDTELDFVNGINVLSGVNGVGKSTIFEAVGYALFGVDARDFVGNIERFLTIGSKRGEVVVVFQNDDGEIYKVTRTVGAGTKWLLAKEIGGEFEVEDHKGAEETESRISELLGLDNGRSLADQFKLVIGPFQSEFLGPFVIKQPTKRQETFDEILGIDAWRKTYKGTKTLLVTLKSKIEILTVEIDTKSEQVSVLPETKEELTELKAKVEIQEKAQLENKKKLKKIEKQLTDLDSQEKKINDINSAISTLEGRIKEGEGKISAQKKSVEEAEQAIKILKVNKAAKEAFDKAEITLKKLRDDEQKRRLVEKDLERLTKQRDQLTQAIEHELREIGENAKQLTKEEKKIKDVRKTLKADDKLIEVATGLKKLLKDQEQIKSEQGLLIGRQASLMEGKGKLAEGACPFLQEPCKNIADKQVKDVFTDKESAIEKELKALDKQLIELNKKIKLAEKAQKEIDELNIRDQELEKQLTALASRFKQNEERSKSVDKQQIEQKKAAENVANQKKNLIVFEGLDKKIEKIEKDRLANQVARDEFLANEKDANDFKNRSDKLKIFFEHMEKLKKELSENQKDLGERNKKYNLKRHAEVRVKKENQIAEIAKINQQIESLEKDVKRLEKEVKKLNAISKEIKKLEKDRKALEEKDDIIKFLRNRVFNLVSTQLSERFREEISLRADRIYRTISDSDEELYWGDKYHIVLRDIHHGEIRERNDDQLSGGQTMSAVVALRLALLQTIGARIAFFDEPTSNLDVARRENLAHAFRAIDVGREEVTEHWYDQLFLISHDVAFTEITDQIISLEAGE